MVTTTEFMRCLCEWKHGDNSRCPRHGSLMARTKATAPSYTLAELRELAREYADERHDEARLAIQLSLSCFVEWLAKREQGKEEDGNNERKG